MAKRRPGRAAVPGRPPTPGDRSPPSRRSLPVEPLRLSERPARRDAPPRPLDAVLARWSPALTIPGGPSPALARGLVRAGEVAARAIDAAIRRGPPGLGMPSGRRPPPPMVATPPRRSPRPLASPWPPPPEPWATIPDAILHGGRGDHRRRRVGRHLERESTHSRAGEASGPSRSRSSPPSRAAGLLVASPPDRDQAGPCVARYGVEVIEPDAGRGLSSAPRPPCLGSPSTTSAGRTTPELAEGSRAASNPPDHPYRRI